MRAGWHSGEITPPIPCGMGGYAARTGPAEGVHDPLCVRSVVLEAGGERVALVTCDILNFDRPMVVQVREQAGKLLGIPPDRIMLLASHTHAGPAPHGWAARMASPQHPGAASAHASPPGYLDWLSLQLVSSLAQAAARLEEVEAAGGVAPVAGLGGNRTDPFLPYDPTLRLLALEAGGDLQAVLLNYGCHPTVLGAENRLISADWPGAAVSALARSLGGGAWVGFAQGCAGDVSPRFTRREQSFAEVERHGQALAGAALTALGRLERGRKVRRIGAASRVTRLAPRPLPDLEEAQRQVTVAAARLAQLRNGGAPAGAVRQAFTALQGAQLALEQSRRQGAQAAGRPGDQSAAPTGGQPGNLDLDCEVQAVCLGDEVAIVGIAGEPFSSLGRAIRERSPFPVTLVAGYANGYCGYLPDRAAFGRGGYEALSALAEPGSGEQLVEVALALLTQLKAEVSAG